MKIRLALLLYLITNLITYSSSSENFFEFKADTIKYVDNNDIIIANGNAKINDKSGKVFFSDKIIYNKKLDIIQTFSNSKFIDNQGNKIFSNRLIYNIKTKEISAKNNVEIIDKKNNKFLLKNIYYNTDTKKGIGEKFSGFFSDKSNINSKKITLDLNKGISIFTKTNYTTCSIVNKNNNSCPWWSINSEKTIHDQKNKEIKHINAFLKIRQLPVLYFPYLKHPDPSVKRQSGFLPPKIKNLSSIGRAISTPYFVAVNDSSDITFTPTYHFQEKPLLLTEYRKKFKTASLIIDSSYAQGYKNTNITGRQGGSRNHLYVNFNSNFKNNFFKENEFKFQLRKVSQENYLKVYKVNTLLAKEDDKNLENKIQLISFNENSSLDLNAKIFEDLNKNKNDKYEYLFPQGSFTHNFSQYNQNINFKSDFFSRKISNEKKLQIINEIDTSSEPKIYNKFGTSHILKTKIKNINFKNNSSNANYNSINGYFTVAIDNSYPLYKKEEKAEKIISPKLFIKYTTGSMNNINNYNKSFLYSDIYSMDRSPNQNSPETGLTFGSGIDYEMSKKNIDNLIYLKNSMGIGQVFRTSKMEQMPINSSLNNTQSNFAGFYKLEFNGKIKKGEIENKKIAFLENFQQNKINIKYDFNIDKSISRLESNDFNAKIVAFNRLNADINFIEKNNYAGSERKLNQNFSFLLNNNFYFTASMIKDLKKNTKESEMAGIKYENDCIIIGLNLKKEFYNENELSNNNKSIFLNIIFKPFANDLSPDLSSFIN